jgi:SAM-dependent methyltransferase
MEARWERLAREDAEFYIWTDRVPGEGFFESGERDVRRIVDFVRPWPGSGARALEIGCGIGRLTIPMSRLVDSVVAVDVAPTMLAKLQDNCGARGVDNVTGYLANDPWDAGPPFDLAYTRIVMQHIESWADIVRYFHRIAGALKPGAMFYAQFDTRRDNAFYRLRNRLPDSVLPRTYRRGVRRIRRRAADLEALATSCGMTLAAERGSGTEDHEFLFAKPG